MSALQGSWADAPVVDIAADNRVWWRRIIRAARLAAAVVRVWWPALLPIAVLTVSGFGFVAAVVVTVLVWVGIGLVSPPARGWMRGRPMATGVAVVRWWWPRVCARAFITHAIDGANRCPNLVTVELYGPWWRPWRPDAARLVIEPLTVHEEDKWPALASRIGRQLRYALVTPRILSPLELEIRLQRFQLRDSITLGVDVQPDAVAPDDTHIDLGDSALGEPVRWSLDDPTHPHALVAGGTGGGKGNVARLVLLWAWFMLQRGRRVTVIVANPKRAGEFRWIHGWARVASTTPGIAAAVRFLYDQLDHRGQVCEAAGVDHFNELLPVEQERLGGRLLFVFDEWSDFITDPFLPNAKDNMGMVLAAARKGRSLGVNLMFNGQHPTGEMFSPGAAGGAGTALIANLGARIAIGSIEASGARTMFGTETVAAEANGDIPGRAYVRGVGPGSGSRAAVTAQMWFAPRDLVRGLGMPCSEVVLAPDFDTEAAQAAEKPPVDDNDPGKARNRKKVS